MKLEFYELLIDAAKEASQRARWTLTASIIISITQLGAVYNFGFSQLRSFIEQLMITTPAASDPAVLKELQSAMIKSWVDQLSVNVNLVGLKFSVADASFVGSLALVIVTTWLFFGIRRENHIIGRTLRMARAESAEIRAHVYYGLSNTQMFATVTDNDAPIAVNSEEGKSTTATSLRNAAVLLLYLPAITMAIMIVTDILSLIYFSAIFRGKVSSTVLDALLNETGALKRVLPGYVAKMIIEIVVLLFLYHVTKRIHRFQRGTTKVLRSVSSKGWGNVFLGDSPDEQPQSSSQIAEEPPK